MCVMLICVLSSPEKNSLRIADVRVKGRAGSKDDEGEAHGPTFR